jgi:hypothetical protein
MAKKEIAADKRRFAQASAVVFLTTGTRIVSWLLEETCACTTRVQFFGARHQSCLESGDLLTA